MSEPMRQQLLDKVGAFLAIAVVVQMTIALILPYVASRLGIALTDSDRALVGQVVGAIINMAMLVVGYFFGSSAKARQDQDTQNKQATAMAAIVAGKATDAPTDALKSGDTVAVVKTDPPTE